jgi:hemoglobin/transferrin/lactoferrin receptor protein
MTARRVFVAARRFTLCAAASAAVCFAATAARAQEAAAADDAPAPAPTYVETISVTATSNPTPIQEIAGTVGRVDRSEIERQSMNTVRDLVRFEPGVEVSGDPTRLGLGGFVIRGIGGNRVQTRVDGVPTAEDFSFGPLGITRFAIDTDSLQSLEILRSAASSLYGSDALGGVVSLTTREPEDYLGGNSSSFGSRLGYDDRDESALAAGHVAFGLGRFAGSLSVDASSGHETTNQGEVATQNSARTVANPSDRETVGGRFKLVHRTSDRFDWRLGAEWFDADAETEVYSARTFQNLGPQFGPGVTYTIDTRDFDADDRRERQRFSAQGLAQWNGAAADTLLVRGYWSGNDTEQRVAEHVVTTQGGSIFGPTRVIDVRRDGLFEVEQDLFGLEAQAKKGIADRHLLTYGLSWKRDSFDMLRDRQEFDAVTGAPRTATVRVPTKYFPESDVDTLGAYAQAELDLAGGRVRLIPGLRYDRSKLDPNETDPIFLFGNPGTPAPTEAEADAVSPKLGVVFAANDRVALFAQYARGFRTPPYSSVNNGFSNATSGYRTLPNPDLDPETSDNAEIGARFSAPRGSLSVTLFDNRYDDFIEQVALGVNPANGLLEYQYQNLTAVEVRGVELAGDHRFADAWRVRGALAFIEGENDATSRPLNSIAPPKAVIGLDWLPGDRPFTAGLVLTYLDEKSADDLDRSAVQQFATPSATLVDLVATYRLGESWSVQAQAVNLLDETSWAWGDVGGLSRTSIVLDRYTSPGRSGSLSFRFTR